MGRACRARSPRAATLPRSGGRRCRNLARAGRCVAGRLSDAGQGEVRPMALDKGLDNVAVHWPRTNQYYDPVAPAEFVDFGAVADAPDIAAPTGALALHIAKTGTVRATAYTELVDLLLGLEGVLYATDAAAEDEDPVIDPDGCAWIAGGLERFVEGHERHGDLVTFDTVAG